VKRNTFVIFAVLFLLAAFGWAGWANWQYRKQAAEKRAAIAAKAELVPAAGGDVPPMISPLMNKPAPAFTLEDLSGKKVSLESYKGKAVLINFWATWCGPCKIETPWLVQLRDQYASKGFEVIGISTEGEDLAPGDKAGWAQQKSDIGKFIKEEKMDYPVLINGDSLAKPYGGLDAMPTSFYVDRNGKVVAAQMGITSKEDMENNIRKALGEGM
jgi:thiol-disulfide isomerase/thioredoxin